MLVVETADGGSRNEVRFVGRVDEVLGAVEGTGLRHARLAAVCTDLRTVPVVAGCALARAVHASAAVRRRLCRRRCWC